jgi:hypothetical protein
VLEVIRQSVPIDRVSFEEYKQFFILVYIAVVQVDSKHGTNANVACRLIG